MKIEDQVECDHADRRALQAAIISDVHLGTHGCHAEELIDYLKSIDPKLLILNGDIIDMWQFKKRYFPESHLRVLKQLMHMASTGVKVIYLTGNHDDTLRKFSDLQFGNIYLRDQLDLRIAGRNYWIFHGDVFDQSIQHARWLAKLGGISYDLLIRFNRLVNRCLIKFGRQPYSFSQKIKANVKKAVSYIKSFETVAADIAIARDYDVVVCGHIHQATIRQHTTSRGSIQYMNSGDWVESLTALELAYGEWRIHNHKRRSSTHVKF